MTLDDYLAGPGGAPWVWGKLDCTLFPCGWIVEATGEDPAEAFRGRYSSALEARRFIKRAGGLVELVRPHIENSGLEATTDPQHGDVGIVIAPIDVAAHGHVAAIRYGHWWLVRGLYSIVVGEYETVAAWSVLPQR